MLVYSQTFVLMKSIIFYLSILLLFTPHCTLASGGSNSTISNISFNQEKKVARYESDFSGGWAPGIPWTYDIDVITGEKTLLFSPKEAEKIFFDDEKSTAEQKMQWRQKVLRREYPEKLKELDLQKLGFFGKVVMTSDVDEFLLVKSLQPPISEGLFYRVEIGRNEKWLQNISLKICLDPEGLNIRGYGLPGEDFVLLILSYRGDCYGVGLPGLYESITLVKNVPITERDTLDTIFNPIAPEGEKDSLICCPLGQYVFHSPQGLHLSIPNYPNKLQKGEESEYLNNKGFSLYKEEKYEEALRYFKQSQEYSDKVNISTFNIACTAAMLDKSEETLKYIQKIIESGEYELIQKIFVDGDLEEYRFKSFFLLLQYRMSEFFAGAIL